MTKLIPANERHAASAARFRKRYQAYGRILRLGRGLSRLARVALGRSCWHRLDRQGRNGLKYWM